MNRTPWYVDAFRSDYIDRYAHRGEDEAKANIDALLQWLPLNSLDAILDLACGAGRHLIALRQAGFTRLAGLDLSADLLDRARKRFRELGISDIRLIHADMRSIGFVDHFDVVLSLFSSFGYFATDAMNAAVIHAIAHALKRGGTVVIDTMNPPYVRATLVAEEQFDRGGQQVRITRNLTSDQRVEKHFLVSRGGVHSHEFFESVRMYGREEMAAMLEGEGFTDIRLAGGLDGREYTPSSPRLVVTAAGGGVHA